MGYVIASPDITGTCQREVHDFLTIGAAAPLMEAVVVGLNFGDDIMKNFSSIIRIYEELFSQRLT